MNKKKIAFILLAVCFTAYFTTIYIVNQADNTLAQKNLSRFNALKKSSTDRQAMEVLANSGCTYCHSANSEMPFYSQLPIAKQLMEKEVKIGIRHFDINTMLNDVEQNNLVSEAALARLEKVLNDDSMPPSLYLSMHWASYLTYQDKQTLLKWIVEKRATRHHKSPVSEKGKLQALQPIYSQFDVDSNKVELGKLLYQDTRLSSDNTVSCVSCHNLVTGGVDNLPVSIGIHGQLGGINAPTVFNSVYNRTQFWDGRAKDLQEQAGGPPLNPIEMGSQSWDEIINKLQKDAKLVRMFVQSFEGEITSSTITQAIAEYEKTLTTPNSAFDKFLMGETQALNAQEKYGLALFKKYNCQTCHVGEAMGGDSFETMGIKEDYFEYRGTSLKEADFGRYNFTKQEQDKHKFKVPTLRNIELTAPYFHDGKAITLKQAIFDMGKFQVGVELSDEEVDAIKAFLKTLTGDIPK